MSESVWFVTGASGFVGRRLCEALRAGGHRVRALARRADPALEAAGVEVVRGDLMAPDGWKHALADAHYVIHCAANASFDAAPAAVDSVNIEGTQRLLTAVEHAASHLRRFVFVSTIGAIDRPRADPCQRPLNEQSPAAPSSAYGRSKWKAEECVRASPLPFAIVRPAMVVGSQMRYVSHFAAFARSAASGALFARGAWPAAFSVVHVDDLADALELCATHPGAADRTFFCAGSPVAIADCFAQVDRQRRRLPLRWAAGLARRLPMLVPFRLKALLLPALTADDRALRALGWTPQFSGATALGPVIERERARINPAIDPGGQTVITGAASGLGEALVERLAPRRRALLLIDRDRAGLERVAARHPHCRIHVADLADEAAVATLLASDAWCAPSVSELFLCAGLGLRGPMLDASADQHARLFKVNVLARMMLAHAALPGMIRARFGRIVFVSSSSAFQPLPFLASYAASNAALLSLGEAWAAELSGTGVRVLVACPGGMQTNFQRAAGVKTLASERLMAPKLVAERIVRALARRRTTVIISTRAAAMSLLARILPRATSVALWKKLMERLR